MRRTKTLVITAALIATSLAPVMTQTAHATPADDRDAAYDAYQTQLEPALATTKTGTASPATCTAGAPSAAAQTATLTALNYLRDLAGLTKVTFSPLMSARAQQAALMMDANGTLSHSPPSSWRCYTATGRQAAADSNLSFGTTGAAAMVAFTYDYGAGNEAAGHRRMLLYPPQRTMGNGMTGRADALLVHGTGQDGTDQGPEWMAWPVEGFFPVQLEPAGRWSLSATGADFSQATVRVLHGGQSLPVVRHAPQNGFGANTLVWNVSGVNTSTGRADDPYTVTVNGIRRNGTTTSHTYTTTLFDATVDARQTITLGAISPKQYGDVITPAARSSAGLPVRFTTTTPDVCTSTGTQIRATGLGTCTVNADQPGDAIRRAAPTQTTSFEVTQRPVVVRPNDLRRPLDTDNPPLTTRFDNIAPGETTGDITGTPTCTTTALKDSPYGAYPITCDITGMTSAHYTLTTAPGTLTVAEDPPQVTLSPAVINAGQRMTATYHGTPGMVLDILSKTQPATTYSKIGTVTLDATGTGTSTHAPTRNTRLAARTPLGTLSTPPLIQVRSIASINAFRVSRGFYVFQGTVSPLLANRLVSLYRNGTLAGQARTNARGIYAIGKVLAPGPTYDFVVRTPNDAYNLGATSRTLRVRIL
jgi:uncharacterized protein YkwD